MSVVDISSELNTKKMDIDGAFGFNERTLIRVLDRLGINIKIATLDGRNIDFIVRRKHKIIDVIRHIKDRIRFDDDDNRLCFQERILEGHRSVQHYNIDDGSTIKIVSRSRDVLQVSAQRLNTTIVAIEVLKSGRISAMKEVMEDKTGISSVTQILTYAGQILDDKKTIDEYDMNEGTVINVGAQFRFLIYVKTMDGRTCLLEVTNTDRIIYVKRKIQEKIGLSPCDQKLIYQGFLLEDDKTVDEYNIAENSVINVVNKLKGGMQIFAKTMDGKTVGLEVTKTDTIVDIKKKIQEKIGLSPDEQKLVYEGVLLADDKTIDEYQIAEKSVINVVTRPRGWMQIFAKTMDGKYVALEVTKTNTIVDIKKKIQKKIELWPDEQKLMYQGGILKDDKTIDEYQIAEKSVINVVARPRGGMQIFAKTMDGKTVAFEVIKTDKIIDIKKKIQEKIGLSPDEQTLKFQGVILDKDDKSIEYYHIIGDSVIDIDSVSEPIPICIKTRDRGSIVLNVQSYYSIADVKKMIEVDTKLSMDKQIIKLEGRVIKDDTMTIHQYGIVNDSNLEVIEISKITITIQSLYGAFSLEIEILNTDTITDLKNIIHERIGLPIDVQILRKGGLRLDNDKTIEYYNIIDHSSVTIDSIFEFIEICVMTVDGGCIILPVNVLNVIIDIKKMIEEKIGVPVSRQVLKIDGKTIEGGTKTVYECHIGHDSKLTVYDGTRITIMILSHNMETIPLEIWNCDSIAEVKMKIQVKVGLSCGDQILVFDNSSLNDEKLVWDYNIGCLGDIAVLGPGYRGLCVVINNEKFQNNWTDRTGTNIDVENIRKTFIELGYRFKDYGNVSSSSVVGIITKIKKKVKRTDTNMIVFVLSHGEKNGVVMTDGTTVPFRNIWTPFSNEAFPQFAGKSKLFFFACCLGSNLNNAVTGASTSTVQYDGPPSTPDLVPAMGDFFLGYATCEFYVACRVPSRGTFYIESLCKVVQDHPLWSVSDIHQEIQKILSKEIIQGTHFQMPQNNSMLRDHAYFHGYL